MNEQEQFKYQTQRTPINRIIDIIIFVVIIVLAIIVIKWVISKYGEQISIFKFGLFVVLLLPFTTIWLFIFHKIGLFIHGYKWDLTSIPILKEPQALKVAPENPSLFYNGMPTIIIFEKQEIKLDHLEWSAKLRMTAWWSNMEEIVKENAKLRHAMDLLVGVGINEVVKLIQEYTTDNFENEVLKDEGIIQSESSSINSAYRNTESISGKLEEAK